MDYQKPGIGWLSDYPDFQDYTFEKINESFENNKKEEIDKLLSPILWAGCASNQTSADANIGGTFRIRLPT
jgi:hypothetical protein